MIVNQLLKYIYFILCWEDITVEEFAYLFYQIVTSRHKILVEIILDRDKLFKSKFWQSLVIRLGVEHKMSIVYYLQTDRQTERINQTLKAYLRCYINKHQDDQLEQLPIAEFVYNSIVYELIKIILFEVNYGFNLNIY